jgi:hypothetical protein
MEPMNKLPLGTEIYRGKEMWRLTIHNKETEHAYVAVKDSDLTTAISEFLQQIEIKKRKQ